MPNVPLKPVGQARRLLLAMATAAHNAVGALWKVARPALMMLFNGVAALVILFEEWGWRPLAALLGRLAHFKAIARLETWIASLPPYPSLLVFALPSAVLLPLKFLAMWLLANDQFAAATALFIGAKIVSTAIVARIFMLTKPALMRIVWFARLYEWFIPWKDALFATVRASWVWRYGRMVKTRFIRMLAPVAARVRAALRSSLAAARTFLARMKA